MKQGKWHFVRLWPITFVSRNRDWSEWWHFVDIYSLCSVLDLTAQQDSMNSVTSSVSKTNDLAEADQENIPSAAVSGHRRTDIELLDHEAESMDNASEAIGAVGGVELCALPDLAKISGPKPEFWFISQYGYLDRL